jgi:hypothetical protein
MSKIRKSANLYLGIFVVSVLVIALIATAVSNNSSKTLSVGTPERAVQQYLQNLIDGRNDLAANALSKDSRCSIQDIDRAYIWRSSEISLLSSQETGSTAIVRVSFAQDVSALMDTSRDEELTYRLVKEGNQWKITGIPWPLYDCGGFKK